MIIILLDVLSDNERDFVDKLFKDSNARLYNISFNILRSHSDAEEAVAQTFLKLMNHIEMLDKLPCPQMISYCVISVKNESISIIRKRKKDVPLEDFDYIDSDEISDNVEETILTQISHEHLLSCVNQLSEEDRLLIQLRYINEMSFREISKLFGISEETAKKRGQRILKKLRNLYQKEENDV